MVSKKKICLISGKFNVLHPGHLRLFRHAKEIAGQLVVGVFADSHDFAGEIMVSEKDRLEGVQANRWVDDAFLITSLSEAILRLKPDIVLKGKEHELNQNEEEKLVQEYGGSLKFAGGDSRLNVSALIHDENTDKSVRLKNSKDFLARHRLSANHLIKSVENVSSIRALVLGDLIVDRYVDCQPIGMSAEDPTVVVSPIAEEKFIGGAGIVSAHASNLGAGTVFVSVRGNDETGVYAETELQRRGVKTEIIADADRPTTQKTRFRANNKTLLRVNELRDHQVDRIINRQLTERVLDNLAGVDLIVFSDFSYGLFSPELIENVTKVASQKGIVMAADSQSSSQIGDIARFPGVTLITPTEREARLAVRDNVAGLVGISQKLREITRAQYTPITLASEGVFLHRPDGEPGGWTDEQIPALNENPIDVSGAGDAFLVSTAMSLAAGEDILTAIYIGSVASACQVSRIGNTPLNRNELIEKLTV